MYRQKSDFIDIDYLIGTNHILDQFDMSLSTITFFFVVHITCKKIHEYLNNPVTQIVQNSLIR